MSCVILVDRNGYSHLVTEDHTLSPQEGGSKAIFQVGSFTQGAAPFLGHGDSRVQPDLESLLSYFLSVWPSTSNFLSPAPNFFICKVDV